MSDQLIDGKHLAYLVTKYLPDSEETKRLAKAVINDTEARSKALDNIALRHPQVRHVLAAEYRTFGVSSVHLCSLPCLGGASEKELVQSAEKRRGVTLTPMVTHLGQKPSSAIPGTHAKSFVLHPDGRLEVSVVLIVQTRNRPVWFSESRHQEHEVTVIINLRDPLRPTEIYGGDEAGYDALLGVLNLFFGASTTGRRREIMNPKEIDQAKVVRVADRLHLADYLFDGEDGEGRQPLAALSGARDPRTGVPKPLDSTDPRVARQRGAKNRTCGFVFSYRHPDGYDEIGVITFAFTQPRTSGIGFRGKASRSAMRWLIDEFFNRP